MNTNKAHSNYNKLEKSLNNQLYGLGLYAAIVEGIAMAANKPNLLLSKLDKAQKNGVESQSNSGDSHG